jgi:hypothetical protein
MAGTLGLVMCRQDQSVHTIDINHIHIDAHPPSRAATRRFRAEHIFE